MPFPDQIPFEFAYIGPGAGFAFLGSFLTLVLSLALSVVSIVLWPLRLGWRFFTRKSRKGATAKKLIIVGLDGLDAKLTEALLGEGKLPNLARLASLGGYRRLRTTCPALSPVAWSTFATGVNPAKHNIFDFLDRDLRTYAARLSSARVEGPKRFLKVGQLRIPLSRASVEFHRKSRPFWTLLGEQGIGCTILRVPITFPAQKFPGGKMLAAMCTPDVKGTQGSFSQFTTRVALVDFENGDRYPLERGGDDLKGVIDGPTDAFVADGGALHIPFEMTPSAHGFTLHLQGESFVLQLGTYTPWIRLRFRTAVGIHASGLVRFLLTELSDEVSLYMSPIQIDPESPVLPISHPAYYANYLAALVGPYATAGMAEDTWALNESVIDEEAFLTQAYDIFRERETMFLGAIRKTRAGVVACVFDTSDRVQHMFHRHQSTGDRHALVIEDMYRKMDGLVGKVLATAGPDSDIVVLSDHGFCSFRRGVNLNTWLHRYGYLHFQNDLSRGPLLAGVDWSRTRAYALGLSGLFLNLRGRETQGIVQPGAEANALKAEIAERLNALRDTDGAQPFRRIYASSEVYAGPYLDRAPDLIAGYNEGYRASWESVTGTITDEIIAENCKPWSGDHCVDPVLVPGVLFANRKILGEDPGIEDLAPSALQLFGVKIPAWMEGQPIL